MLSYLSKYLGSQRIRSLSVESELMKSGDLERYQCDTGQSGENCSGDRMKQPVARNFMFSDPGLIHWTAVDQHWIFLLSGYISLAPCSPFPFHSGRAQSSCFTFFHYNYIALFFDSILFSDAVWVFLMLTYFIYTILCDFLGSYKNGHTI